jgi:hypothetical protein
MPSIAAKAKMIVCAFARVRTKTLSAVAADDGRFRDEWGETDIRAEPEGKRVTFPSRL